MLNDVLEITAVTGVTYAVFFSVTMTLMIVFKEPYKGLSVPAGILASAAVLCVVLRSIW